MSRDKYSFKKTYKFKINLLISTKLTIFFNSHELDNWVLYIRANGVLFTPFVFNYKIIFKNLFVYFL